MALIVGLCALALPGVASAQSPFPAPLGSAGTFPPPSPQNLASTPNQSTPAARAATNGETAAPDYRLGSGDRVHITVFGQEELTGDYQVDGTGKLAFPLIGQIQAGGLTAKELEQALRSALSPEYLKDPKVSAAVLNYRPFYILGEVKTPGSYSYVSGMTVINAVALAGGFTPRAKENDFYLSRMGRDGHRNKVDAGQDTPVQPGDVITVRERWF